MADLGKTDVATLPERVGVKLSCGPLDSFVFLQCFGQNS